MTFGFDSDGDEFRPSQVFSHKDPHAGDLRINDASNTDINSCISNQFNSQESRTNNDEDTVDAEPASADDQLKIVLMDLFGYDFVIDFLNQHSSIDERQIALLKEAKWVSRSVLKFGISCLEKYTDNLGVIEDLIEKKKKHQVCDKCHRKLAKPMECQHCFKQMHSNCFGKADHCVCCELLK
eukprot:TCONS_00036037-protein